MSRLDYTSIFTVSGNGLEPLKDVCFAQQYICFWQPSRAIAPLMRAISVTSRSFYHLHSSSKWLTSSENISCWESNYNKEIQLFSLCFYLIAYTTFEHQSSYRWRFLAGLLALTICLSTSFRIYGLRPFICAGIWSECWLPQLYVKISSMQDICSGIDR